jgi:excinuclease ABC subunit B
VQLTIADDPLARQEEVEKAVEGAKAAGGRSTGGRGGMHGGKRSRGGRR